MQWFSCEGLCLCFSVLPGEGQFLLGFMDVQGCCLLGILDPESIFVMGFVVLESLFYAKVYGSQML